MMNNFGFAKLAAAAAGIIFALAAPVLVYADNSQNSAVQASKAAPPMNQLKADSLPQDDFAGLNYTDEQKAKIDKIHWETEAHKAAVVNAPNLNDDQKNAMLLGYTRMEYGSIFQVLSPEQQKQVRQKMNARKAAAQAEQRKQHPLN
jgi:Spy/CpxP family protein refolding chaperone